MNIEMRADWTRIQRPLYQVSYRCDALDVFQHARITNAIFLVPGKIGS